jgi:hypothetical protein
MRGCIISRSSLQTGRRFAWGPDGVRSLQWPRPATAAAMIVTVVAVVFIKTFLLFLY